ncbi:MAG: hypothetical protein NC925_04955, partial [Candidatus Omnitrophica bacterium]|nr:hypothetical protein [Candidatus Omnitrophota bacterium]
IQPQPKEPILTSQLTQKDLETAEEKLNEAIKAHQEAQEKVNGLENQVKKLKEEIERLQTQPKPQPQSKPQQLEEQLIDYIAKSLKITIDSTDYRALYLINTKTNNHTIEVFSNNPEDIDVNNPFKGAIIYRLQRLFTVDNQPYWVIDFVKPDNNGYFARYGFTFGSDLTSGKIDKIVGYAKLASFTINDNKVYELFGPNKQSLNTYEVQDNSGDVLFRIFKLTDDRYAIDSATPDQDGFYQRKIFDINNAKETDEIIGYAKIVNWPDEFANLRVLELYDKDRTPLNKYEIQTKDGRLIARIGKIDNNWYYDTAIVNDEGYFIRYRFDFEKKTKGEIVGYAKLASFKFANYTIVELFDSKKRLRGVYEVWEQDKLVARMYRSNSNGGKIVFEEKQSRTVNGETVYLKPIFKYVINNQNQVQLKGDNDQDTNPKNYSNVIGWVRELEGQYILKLSDNKQITFTLVQELDKDSKVIREFGLIGGEELIQIGFGRRMFIVDGKILGGEYGYTYIVEPDNSNKQDKNFKVIYTLHRSRRIEFSNLPSFENIEQILNSLGGFSRPSKENLIWIELEVLDKNGMPITDLTSYQAFSSEQGPVPVIIINKDFIDIVLEKTISGTQQRYSIRFDLTRTGKDLTKPIAISRYLDQEHSLVIDFVHRLAFVEKRDQTNRFLLEKWNLKVTNESIFDISELKDVLNILQGFSIKNGDLAGEGLVVESKEIMKYEAPNDFSVSLNGKKITGSSLTALLKALGVPYRTAAKTKNKELISESTLTGLELSDSIKITYQRSDYHQKAGAQPIRIVTEIQENGRLVEVKFNDNTREILLYLNETLKRYGIASATLRLIKEGNFEYIHTISSGALFDLNTGRIIFIKKWIIPKQVQYSQVQYSEGIDINNIFTNNAYRVQVVIKDGRGRDIITLDGYDTFSPQIYLQENDFGNPL